MDVYVLFWSCFSWTGETHKQKLLWKLSGHLVIGKKQESLWKTGHSKCSHRPQASSETIHDDSRNLKFYSPVPYSRLRTVFSEKQACTDDLSLKIGFRVWARSAFRSVKATAPSSLCSGYCKAIWALCFNFCPQVWSLELKVVHNLPHTQRSLQVWVKQLISFWW